MHSLRLDNRAGATLTPAQPGDFQFVDVRTWRRRTVKGCAACLLVGVFLGAYVSHRVFADPDAPISRALVQVGDDLCKYWQGLAEIARVGPKNFAFKCHSLAVFPDVEVTLARDREAR